MARSSHCAASAAVLVIAALALPRTAHGITVDLSTLGTYRSSVVQQSGLMLRPETNLPLLSALQWNGVGVVGGINDNTLDPGESLLFRFTSPASAVTYFVQFGQDVDGDGYFGEALIEGYGADGTLVGVSAASGVGPIDVSGRFGGVPLSAFRVLTRDGDRQRVYSASFTTATGPHTLDLSNLGTYKASTVHQTELTLTAEVNLPLLNVLQWNGVGVVGGINDNTLDPGESLLFRFTSPATAVTYFVQFGQDVDGDGYYGEALIEGYGADGTLVGVSAVNQIGPIDVSGRFDGVPLSAFRVLTRDGDRQRVYSASFTTATGPHTLDLSNLGTYKASTVHQTELTLTAEVNLPLLNVLQWNGVGVVGGTSDNTLDPNESLLFRFSSPAIAVTYYVQFGQDVDGDGYFGEALIEGYGADGTLVGVSAANGVGPIDVSARFGGVPLSAFRVLTRDGDRQRVYSVSFDQALDVDDGTPPGAVALRLAGPNPVRGQGALSFEIPFAARVDIVLYDVQGRQVRDVLNGMHPPGVYRATLDSYGLESGMYFAVMRLDGRIRGKVKVSVLR